MAYIGNQPFTTAFLTDQFSGNGSTTAFTLSAAPANTNSLLVAITGVLQDPSTYSVAGTTLTFSAAPPSGTANISVRFLGIPASGVVTTAYRTLTEFTATAGQTTFTPPSYTVGYINVFRNGVMLGTADYTASNGTTVVLASAASAGDLVVTESFYVSSVLNALPTSGGTLSGALIVPNFTYTGTLTGSTSVLNIGSGQIYKDASGNVGIGTSSPATPLNIYTAAARTDFRLSTGKSSGELAAFQCFGLNSSSASVGYAQIVAAASSSTAGSHSGYLAFETAVSGSLAERARIDSSGNLLVGNSTASQTMDGLFVRGKVASTGNQWNFLVYTQSGSFTLGCRDDYYLRSPAVYDRTSGGAANVFVDSSGYLYRSTSSIRYKRDVVSYDKGLETVSALRPVYYKSNVESPDGAVRDEQYAGFIAEEVAAAGLEEFVVRNDQGQPDALHYGNMVSLLTKAIQELTAKLDAAEARIAALENKA